MIKWIKINLSKWQMISPSYLLKITQRKDQSFFWFNFREPFDSDFVFWWVEKECLQFDIAVGCLFKEFFHCLSCFGFAHNIDFSGEAVESSDTLLIKLRNWADDFVWLDWEPFREVNPSDIDFAQPPNWAILIGNFQPMNLKPFKVPGLEEVAIWQINFG